MNKRPLSASSSSSSNNGHKRSRTSQHTVGSTSAANGSGEDDPMTRLTLALPGYDLTCSEQHPPTTLGSSSSTGESDFMTKLTLELPGSGSDPRKVSSAISESRKDNLMTGLTLALPGNGSYEISIKRKAAAEMVIEETSSNSWPAGSDEERKEMIRNVARSYMAKLKLARERRYHPSKLA